MRWREQEGKSEEARDEEGKGKDEERGRGDTRDTLGEEGGDGGRGGQEEVRGAGGGSRSRVTRRRVEGDQEGNPLADCILCYSIIPPFLLSHCALIIPGPLLLAFVALLASASRLCLRYFPWLALPWR